jgi:hypothetical protein
MRKIPFTPLGVLACLILAAVAGFWVMSLMDSLFSYRSPLRLNPPAPGSVVDPPGIRRLVIVLIDGLREDTSREAGVMPTLNQLRQQSAWAVMHSRPPSFSEPGYAVLLTGAWPDLSDGPAANLDYEDIYPFTQDDLFSAAHRIGVRTAVSGYYWFEKLIPAEAVDAGFFTPGVERLADREVVDAALPWLESGEYGLVLIHLDQLDYAGHYEGGPRHPSWDEAASRTDALLAEIAARLDFTQDTLLVVSDHGHIDAGGHGGQDPLALLEPFILTGAGVRPGQYEDVQMVDVAPTAALLLGASLPASTQGRPLAEMLELNEEDLPGLLAVYQTQQAGLLDAYTAAIGQPRQTITPPGSPGLMGIHAAYQGALKAAQSTRQRTERLLRTALAVPAGLLMIFLLTKISRPKLWWYLVSAMVYVLLFNLRYAVVDQNTYSLSSVTGQTELILYTGSTACLSLLAGWLLSSYGIGRFRPGSNPSAARQSIEQALVIAAVLALPVLGSYVYNGALVSWILPDFASSFVAFLSLLQILWVSLSAILIASLSSLASLLVIRRASLQASRKSPAPVKLD